MVVVLFAFPESKDHPEINYSVKYTRSHGDKPEGVLAPGQSLPASPAANETRIKTNSDAILRHQSRTGTPCVRRQRTRGDLIRPNSRFGQEHAIVCKGRRRFNECALRVLSSQAH